MIRQSTKRNAGPSEPQAPSLGWSYTSDAGHEQETALCRMIKEGFLEEVAFGLDSGETWDRAFWLWSWWDSCPGFSKIQQEEAASGKLPKVRLKVRWRCCQSINGVDSWGHFSANGRHRFLITQVWVFISVSERLQSWNQKTVTPWKKSYDKPRQHIKKQRHHFANKGP